VPRDQEQRFEFYTTVDAVGKTHVIVITEFRMAYGT